jgi:hypothetical protein
MSTKARNVGSSEGVVPMKKIVLALMVLASVAGSAAGTPTGGKFELGAISGGATVVVPVVVHIESSTGSPCGGVQVTIEYDSLVTDFVSAALGSEIAPKFELTNVRDQVAIPPNGTKKWATLQAFATMTDIGFLGTVTAFNATFSRVSCATTVLGLPPDDINSICPNHAATWDLQTIAPEGCGSYTNLVLDEGSLVHTGCGGGGGQELEKPRSTWGGVKRLYQ